MTLLSQAIPLAFGRLKISQHIRIQAQKDCPKINAAEEIAWPKNVKAGNTLAGTF